MIDKATSESLSEVRENLSRTLGPHERTVALKLQMALPDWRWWGGAANLGRKFIDLATTAAQEFPSSTLINISRFVVVDVALKLPETLAARSLPAEVLAMYPAALKRLGDYLRQPTDLQYCYPHDSFVKDVRFAAGLSIPCGAQDVDLRGLIGYRASMRCLMSHPSARFFRSFMRHGQIARWYRIHTDSRYLEDFNEPGWDACYRRIAALMRDDGEVLGMAGTSWFYDPQLDEVSPRLSYLRARPIERGAYIMRSGTLPFDIQSATAKSAHRRRLYEAGKYTPIAYTLIWPRDKLLAWAQA